MTLLHDHRLQGVHPTLGSILSAAAASYGRPVGISEGLRDRDRQAKLVQQGKSRTMNSRHLTGRAADIHLLGPDGSANWDFPAYESFWTNHVQPIAAERGVPITWGGNWKSLRDGVHFELGPDYDAGWRSPLIGKAANGTLAGGLSITPTQEQDTMQQGLLGMLTQQEPPQRPQGLLGQVLAQSHGQGGGGGPWAETGSAGDNAIQGGLTMIPPRRQTPAATTAPMQYDSPRGLLGMMFPNMSAETRDTIRMGMAGLGGLSVVGPNTAVQQGVLQRRADYRAAKERDGQRQAKTQQRNQTLEWIADQARQNPAYAELYEAAAAGVISPGEAFNTVYQMKREQGQPVRGINIGGRLVNPQTGAVMADFSEGDSPSPYTQAGKLAADLRAGLIDESQYRAGLARMDDSAPSSAEAEIGRIMETVNPNTQRPFTREEAIQVADLSTVSRDPVTGEAQILNRASGRPMASPAPQTPPALPPPSPSPERSPAEFGNVAGALGARGVAANTVNTIGDTLGLGLAFPCAEQAESALRNLSTQTMLTLSGEWAGRPSNLTRERIEQLTVRPNELKTGQGGALIKLRDMRRLIENAISASEGVQAGRYSPTQKTQAQQRVTALSNLLQQYNGVIANLEGSAGNGGGQTSSGVRWSVEP
ncbi:MAG: M15 family metallopeptidase [Pseudomonadota bacterium]